MKKESEITRKIVDAGLSVPVIAFLEMHKPLQTVFQTALIFFEPLLKPFIKKESLQQLHSFFEDEKSIETLISAIEHNQKIEKVS